MLLWLFLTVTRAVGREEGDGGVVQPLFWREKFCPAKIKGPYTLGDFGVNSGTISGTIGRRQPIVPPITLWVWPID